MFDLSSAILNRNSSYRHNLTLARLGTLPFFILTCAVCRVILAPFVATPSSACQATYYSIPGNFDTIRARGEPFAWLIAYKPVTRIGKSIFVYHIPP